MKSENNSKNLIYKVLLVVFAIGFFVCAGLLFYQWWQEKEAQKHFDNLQSNGTENSIGIQTSTESEDAFEGESQTEALPEVDILEQLGIEVPEKKLDWKELHKTNKDIYAWIYIPNTQVDYPILQHDTDDDYYLNYNLDGSKGYPGCIYTQYRYNEKDFTDFNTLIYGHDMKNGTMFHTLHNFEDRSFFEKNRYIYIYTPEYTYVYDIFAAYVFSDVHILNYYSDITEDQRQEYLDDVFGIRDMSAHFREDVEVTTDSRLVTLSTCIGGRPNNRYLVQGVLVNPPSVEEDR